MDVGGEAKLAEREQRVTAQDEVLQHRLCTKQVGGDVPDAIGMQVEDARTRSWKFVCNVVFVRRSMRFSPSLSSQLEVDETGEEHLVRRSEPVLAHREDGQLRQEPKRVRMQPIQLAVGVRQRRQAEQVAKSALVDGGDAVLDEEQVSERKRFLKPDVPP